MKKTLLLSVLSVLVLSLISCGGEAVTEEVFDVDFLGNDSESINLEGYVMDYSICPVTTWGVTDTNESYLGFTVNSVFADAAIKRVNDIETNYNCKIEVDYDADIHNKVFRAAASGLHVADLVSGISDLWGEDARSGVLVGMSEVSDIIDIRDSAKWGQKAFLETFFYEDDCYGVTPAAWPDLTYTNFGYPIVTNTDLILSMGYADPREFVENKQWSWDKFFDTMHDYTVVEGGETKYYGMIIQWRMLDEMFLFSNGSNIVEVSDEGEITYGLYDSRGQKAMDAALSLVYGEHKDVLGHSYLSAGYVELAEAFANEVAVTASIYTGYLYGRDAIVGAKSTNYGILPWPHGPDVADDYTFSVIENIYTGIAIPVTAKSVECTATILNALYEPLEGFEKREDIRDYMTYYYFFDERDADVFFDMYDNAKYNYFHYMATTSVDFTTKNITSTQFIESRSQETTNLFNTGVVPAVRGIINLMGSYYYDE